MGDQAVGHLRSDLELIRQSDVLAPWRVAEEGDQALLQRPKVASALVATADHDLDGKQRVNFAPDRASTEELRQASQGPPADLVH